MFHKSTKQTADDGKKLNQGRKFDSIFSYIARTGGFTKEMVNGQHLEAVGSSNSLPYILLIVGLTLAYINNHYAYDVQRDERRKLERQLEDVRYKCVDMKATLTQKGRRNDLLVNLKMVGSEVTIAQQQPVVVK